MKLDLLARAADSLARANASIRSHQTYRPTLIGYDPSFGESECWMAHTAWCSLGVTAETPEQAILNAITQLRNDCEDEHRSVALDGNREMTVALDGLFRLVCYWIAEIKRPDGPNAEVSE